MRRRIRALPSPPALNNLDDLWDLVQFFEEFLDALGIERCHLIGHSYGGFCAAELVAHRPDRISRLVLVNSLGLWLEEKPVADFFILTPDERREMMWHDPDSELARAYVAQPTEPEERFGIHDGPHSDFAVRSQVHLAHTGTRP